MNGPRKSTEPRVGLNENRGKERLLFISGTDAE